MGELKYELYESNDGGLYLYLLDKAGEPEDVYSGWENFPLAGVMKFVLHQLECGIKPDRGSSYEHGIGCAYRESCEDGELIAYNGWVQRGALMEAAGRRAFGYPEW